jgi:HlyD family secretion protein
MKRKLLWILLLAFTLTGCGAFSKTTPTPLPTVVLGNNSTTTQAAASSPGQSGGGVTASGVVVPAQQAQIASAAGGNITGLDVSEGQQVKAGQVLVRLAGSEKVQASIGAANLELLSAQQALKTLHKNADSARTAAQLRLANAQKALDEAQKRRTWKQYRNGSQSAIELAQADLVLAKDALQNAQDYFNGFAGKSETDLGRAQALSALSAARSAYDKALSNLNYLQAMPNVIDVNQVEAEYQSAKAEVANAQAAYDPLKNGPDPDALALAEERVKNAQAQVNASQASLDDLELRAPFAGTVARVNLHSGEWAVPGQPILVLADLEHLRIETTDLSERDIPQIKAGQPAVVTVKALNKEVSGHVSEISPLADTLGGDVVYKTTLDLDTRLPGLRAGMSVEVQFGN